MLNKYICLLLLPAGFVAPPASAMDCDYGPQLTHIRQIISSEPEDLTTFSHFFNILDKLASFDKMASASESVAQGEAATLLEKLMLNYESLLLVIKQAVKHNILFVLLGSDEVNADKLLPKAIYYFDTRQLFLVGVLLGEGATKTVCEVINLGTLRKCALGAQKLDQNTNVSKYEIAILERLRGRLNILQMHRADDYYVTDNLRINYLVTELYNMGSLRQCMGRLSYDKKLKVGFDVTIGISELHAIKMCHGDIKADNIFVNINDQGDVLAVVGDFGLSYSCTESPLMFMGSPMYMAPELFLVPPEYGIQNDAWSAGVLFSWLFFGGFPYGGQSKNLDELKESLRHFLLSRSSPEPLTQIDDVISRFLQPKKVRLSIVDARPIMEELLKIESHRFMSQALGENICWALDADFYMLEQALSAMWLYDYKHIRDMIYARDKQGILLNKVLECIEIGREDIAYKLLSILGDENIYTTDICDIRPIAQRALEKRFMNIIEILNRCDAAFLNNN